MTHTATPAEPLLLPHFDLLATAPGGVARLRELILTLAVQGKLVPQDPSDEPACVLLQRIRAEKDRLIAAGKIKRDKPLPPIADEEKPFELPQGWEWVPLGEVINIIRGITFPATQKTKEPAPGRIACLRTSNVQKTIEWDDLLFVDRSFMGREEQLIQHHDIVMSMANSRELVGKVALIENVPHLEATFGGFLGVLRSEKIEPRYTMAVLRTPYARTLLIDNSSQTTNIANISLAKLRPMALPLPPLAEQSRIVARVEELMRLCDALEAQQTLHTAQHTQLVQTLLGTLTDSATPAELAYQWQRVAAHFDTLFDRPEAVDALEQTILQLAVRGLLVPQDPNDEPASALLQRIRAEKDRLIAAGKIKRDKPLPPITDEEKPFELPQGWEWARFGSLPFESFTGLDRGRDFQSNSFEYLYFKMNNISNDGENNFSGMIRVDASLFEVNKFRLRWDDFLFNTRNSAELVGKTSVIKDLPEDVVLFNNNILVSRFFGYIESEFLNFWFCSKHGRFQLNKIKSSTTNVCAIYQGKLFEFLCPIPPIENQSRIVAHVKELRQLCNNLRQRLAAGRTTQRHLAEALLESAGAA